MAAGPDERPPDSTPSPGQGVPATDEPASTERPSRHPKLLWAVALLEFCAAAGDGLSRWIVGDNASSAALSLHSWFGFIGAIPAGWLGDRYLGARRATMLGAALAVAGLLAVAVPSPLALYLGLAARATGVALLRGNMLVLLSRAYDGRDTRRLEGFIWVGLAASVTGTVLSVVRTAVAVPPIIATTVVAVLVAVAIGAVGRSERTTDRSVAASGLRAFRPGYAAAFVITVVAAGALLYAVDQWPLPLVIADSLFPVSAGIALVLFLAWWMRAARVLSRADNRRVGTFLKLLASAVIFGAVSGVIANITNESGAALTPWVALPLLTIGPGAAWYLRQRARSHPAPSAAGVFSIAFYLQAVACVIFAAMVVLDLNSVVNVQLALDVLFVASSGLAGILVTAGGRSAATSLASALLAGTMLGLWQTTATIGSSLVGMLVPPGTLDRDTHGIALMAAAAACVLLGMVLQAHRQALARDEVAEPPPPIPPSRLRTVSMSLSGAIATLGVVWIVIGRGVGADAVVAATRHVTFGDASTAYLPDDATYGLVAFAPGPFAFGGEPSSPAAAAASQISTGQSIALGELQAGKYEVTVAQYRQCVTEGACRPADPRAAQGPDEWPVRYVTWFEANEYCVWLEQRLRAFAPSSLRFGEDLHVALPSEPEWERLGSGRGVEGFPWRGPLTPARANYAGSARLGPVPVGEFGAGATAEGIHDLSGNVAEWTRSEYRPYPYEPGDGREDPGPGPATRVIRGGSFYDDGSLLRVTSRRAADPASGYEFVGFRVVITRFQPQVESQPQYQQTAPPATAQ